MYICIYIFIYAQTYTQVCTVYTNSFLYCTHTYCVCVCVEGERGISSYYSSQPPICSTFVSVFMSSLAV